MGKKILIVEDEQYLLEMYKMKFEQAGYTVFASENGENGLALAAEHLPDLILLDIMLPKMDGYEVLAKLKADDKTKGLRVYVLSNLGQSHEVKKGVEYGAEGYFIKSNLTPTELLDKVNKIFLSSEVSQAAVNNGTVKQEIKKDVVEQEDAGSETDDGDPAINVLFVEDNEGLVEMYLTQFNKEKNLVIDVARNGAWGLKLANEKHFDIIVLDMVMPAMDGYEMISQLKGKEETRNIPIIVLSNSAQDKDIEAAKAAGVESYLLKSKITPKQLIREIKKIIK